MKVMKRIKTSIKKFVKKVVHLICPMPISAPVYDEYLQKFLYDNEKYQSPDKLNRYEFSAFSQNGEDGIIEEIFNRIGSTDKFFVEFGSSDGVENNSAYLLHKGWNGVFIDGSQDNVNTICKNCAGIISQGRLKVLCNFITAENIEILFGNAGVSKEFDFLSIDIDRNDYYVWDAIKSYRPRVVCIEYNAVFRPGCEFIVPYDANAAWDGSSHHGASIESLYKLGLQKGYKLVACCFAGVNAFFVREDLIGDKFTPPFTPKNHYEPPRFFLGSFRGGHPRKIVL
jgi:hypothetical protein